MFNFTVIHEPDNKAIDTLYQGLLSYNLPFLHGAKHLPLMLCHDVDGVRLAGIYGDVLGNWLRIRYLWVHESCRSQKIGSALLLQCETLAAQHGAKYVELDTFNFQALPFYQKHGYEIFGQLEDYPIDGQKYYLRKKLPLLK